MRTLTAIAITIGFLVKLAGFAIFVVGFKTTCEWLNERFHIIADDDEYAEQN